jgi:hypothetical protein
MNKKTIMLAKFGEHKHLKMLRDGILYFNPIYKYRNDGTDYRGDKLEGHKPLNPKTIKLINPNGKDLFSDLGVPYPDSVTQSIQGDDDLFILCAAKIDINNLSEINTDEYVFSNEFKESIRQFGEFAVLFDMSELLFRLRAAQKDASPPFGYKYDSIFYINFKDFSNSDEINNAYNRHKSPYNQYFVKDLKYKNQNEWRIIIDGSTKHLKANCGEGYSLEVGKFDWVHICKTSIFLDTLRLVDNNKELKAD